MNGRSLFIGSAKLCVRGGEPKESGRAEQEGEAMRKTRDAGNSGQQSLPVESADVLDAVRILPPQWQALQRPALPSTIPPRPSASIERIIRRASTRLPTLTGRQPQSTASNAAATVARPPAPVRAAFIPARASTERGPLPRPPSPAIRPSTSPINPVHRLTGPVTTAPLPLDHVPVSEVAFDERSWAAARGAESASAAASVDSSVRSMAASAPLARTSAVRTSGR